MWKKVEKAIKRIKKIDSCSKTKQYLKMLLWENEG